MQSRDSAASGPNVGGLFGCVYVCVCCVVGCGETYEILQDCILIKLCKAGEGGCTGLYRTRDRGDAVGVVTL